MDIYALDENFNLVDIAIPYENLQWNRRYYDFGDFQVELPLEIYNPSWAYIGTADRPELGMVQKIEEMGDNEVTVLLSGFFCEKMLDDKTCYPRFKGTYTTLEAGMRAIFNKFKDDLPITLAAANSPALGSKYVADFVDDEMGTKFYSLCEPDEISYRVLYNYEENKLYLKFWKGLDRTQSQSVNNYYVFSLEFGNVGSRAVDLDYSDYKNYAIVPCNADDNGKEKTTYYVDKSNGGYQREIVLDFRSERPEDGESTADFKSRIIGEATERLMGYLPVEDIEITPISDDDYMVNYDLGDKCDVNLTDVGITLETRIVEVLEVFKADGGHTVTVGLGNKRISNIKRIVRS